MHDASTSSSSFPSPTHRGQLASLARHLTSDGNAEDYVHDAYVAALSVAQPPQAEAAWLRQVMRNSIRETARRRRRWQELEPLVPEAAPEHTPQRYLERTEVSEAIHAALDELDPKYRDVLRRRFFAGATSREIAASLGCPPGTVRWRLHEGLRRLKRALDERFGERARWCGAAFALRVPAPTPALPPPLTTQPGTEPATQPGPRPSMLTPTILKAALVLCSVAGVATVAAGTQNQDDEPPTAEASLQPAVLAADAGRDDGFRQRDALRRRRAAAQTNADARRERLTSTPVADIPDAKQCGDEEVAAFNANDDAPNADEHLIDAAQCYEEAGMLGRVVLLHVQLRRRFPESSNAETSRDKLLGLYPRLLDPNEATRSPLAKACTAPVRGTDAEIGAPTYIAAADCLRPGGLVGLELSLRRAAQASFGEIDDAENDAEIERLERIEDQLRQAAKKLKSARGSAAEQAKASSAAVQAAVECGRLHRPKDGASTLSDSDEAAVALAGCFEEKGLLGKAVLVHELLLRDDDEGRHRPAARRAMQALLPRILDVDEPRHNPLGKRCVAPIDAAGSTVTVAQLLTAADCLSEASMVGAELQYLRRALKLAGKHNRDEVRAELKQASARKAEYEKKAETYGDAG